MRKILHIFLSILIVYATTTSAYAASPAGWTATAADVVMSGATATITAFKGSGSTALKSVITHKPTAVAVGKNVVRLGSGVAIAYALSEILGEGVDWVMDPANNSVIYTADSGTCVGNSCQYLWSSVQNNSAYATYQTPQAAGTAACSIINGYERLLKVVYGRDDTYWIDCTGSSGNTRRAVSRHANPDYDPDAPTTEEKYIPISDVSAKVIANAEAGHAESQDFVKSVAVGAVESGELDAGLDAVAEPTTDTANPDAPAEPTDPVSEPFDPAGIITAIGALKAMLAGLVASVAGLSDMFGADAPPEKPAEVVPVSDAPPAKSASEFDVNYVSFGGQCPILPSFSIGIGAVDAPMSFDMTPLCELAVMIKPAIVAMGYFIGLGIVASAIRGS